MRRGETSPAADLAEAVRLHLFSEAARTARVPQARAIASALDLSETDVRGALKELAAAKVLILAPNDGQIWAANPFCAVPSGFRVRAEGRSYWGICIWDALGVVAALGADEADVSAQCGDCGERIELRVEGGELRPSDDVVHFAVPTRRWWENVGFT